MSDERDTKDVQPAQDDTRPANAVQMHIDFATAISDQQYVKADVAHVCHLGNTYAISFYQIDYQQVMIAQLQNKKNEQSDAPVPAKIIPAGRFVLDQEGLRFLLNELSAIARKTGIIT